MKRSTKALGIILLAAYAPAKSFAWGASGHRWIGELAAEAYPPDLPDFLRTPIAIEQLGELAREPDRSKGTGQPHDVDRDPAHYVDLSDDHKVLEGPSLDALPENRRAYDTELRKVGRTEYEAGYLPYSIIDGWQQLVKDFAYWRADVAAQTYAKSPAEKAWFQHDQVLREAITLRDLGTWSHYVGDASQPMHVSVHFNGWGDFPNPHHFAQAKIHAPFEGEFVRRYIAETDVRRLMRPYADCKCSIQQAVVAYLETTQSQIVPLYRIEKATSGYRKANRKAKRFVASRLAAGASELRDLVVDAWHASDRASVGYPAVPLGEVLLGKTDPFEQMRGED